MAVKLGTLIDRLFMLRDAREVIRKKEKEATEGITNLQDQILEKLDELGVEKAAGVKGSVTKKIAMMAGLDDKESFYRWAVQNNAFEFTQSSVNSAAVREMFEQQNKLPDGVKTYTKTSLSVRKS